MRNLGHGADQYVLPELPLQCPKVLGAGAAFDPDPLTGDPDVLTDAALRERNSPMWLVRNTHTKADLFLGTSRQGPDRPDADIEAFGKAVAGTGVTVKTSIKPDGGHNWEHLAQLLPRGDPLAERAADHAPPARRRSPVRAALIGGDGGVITAVRRRRTVRRGIAARPG